MCDQKVEQVHPDSALEVILARIEVKLDRVISDTTDHESRLRRLERLVWSASGAALVGGGSIGAIVSKFT